MRTYLATNLHSLDRSEGRREGTDEMIKMSTATRSSHARLDHYTLTDWSCAECVQKIDPPPDRLDSTSRQAFISRSREFSRCTPIASKPRQHTCPIQLAFLWIHHCYMFLFFLYRILRDSSIFLLNVFISLAITIVSLKTGMCSVGLFSK